MIRPARKTSQMAKYPAPIGGINTIDGGTEMPPQDAVYLYNCIAAEYGLRSRLGYKEWAINLTGATTNAVPSVLPFSASNPTNDKVFATTSTGIWDVTDSSTAPARSLAFGVTSGQAGWGISTVASTPGGRFLLYCDEVNGYHVYNEAGSWARVAAGVAQPWEPSTSYLVGDEVVNGPSVYQCTVAGMSAASGGPTGTGTGIVDNAATWNYVSAKVANAIGPSLGDQQAGLTIDPGNFVFVVVFQKRVWLVERNSSRAWYLDTNSIYGVATSFDFGERMRQGGPLRGLFDWSYDGGNGLSTNLVGISSAGDIVIYQGTDPSSASTWGLKGTWSVGGVPAGRRIATNYGGDLLVLSLVGAIPLSRLVVGRDPEDWKQYETAKITNLLNDLATQRQTVSGWAILIHPTDNALLMLVPTADGAPTEQLAMVMGGQKGWSRYRDLPMLSAGALNGVLYFGTVDGRVCQNAGYVDDVLLAHTTPVTHTAGSGPLIATSGAPSGAGTVDVIVTAGGSPGASPGGGTSYFQWRLNGVIQNSPQFCFTDGNALGTTGVTIVWPAGTYTTADAYSFNMSLGGESVPVQYSGLTAFRDNDGRLKRVSMIRAQATSQAASPLIQCTAKFDFDTTEPTPPSGAPTGGANSWDTAKWDQATFGGDYSASQTLAGAVGMGRNVAVAFQGSAVARTVIIGFDVFCTEGGELG